MFYCGFVIKTCFSPPHCKDDFICLISSWTKNSYIFHYSHITLLEKDQPYLQTWKKKKIPYGFTSMLPLAPPAPSSCQSGSPQPGSDWQVRQSEELCMGGKLVGGEEGKTDNDGNKTSSWIVRKVLLGLRSVLSAWEVYLMSCLSSSSWLFPLQAKTDFILVRTSTTHLCSLWLRLTEEFCIIFLYCPHPPRTHKKNNKKNLFHLMHCKWKVENFYQQVKLK